MIRLVLLIILAVPLVAADLVVRDLTLGLESQPTAFSWRLDHQGAVFDGDDAFDSHVAVVGGGRWSFTRPGGRLGLIVGVEGALGDGRFADGGSLRWAEARALAGMGWSPAPRWTAQALVRTALGADRLDLALGQAGGTATGDGGHVAWAPEAGMWWDGGTNWRLGLAAGWRWSHSRIASTAGDVELVQSGPTVALTWAWSVSRAPGSLE